MPYPRRRGKPRTEAERKQRHKRLYGTSKLPARGSGLAKRKLIMSIRAKKK